MARRKLRQLQPNPPIVKSASGQPTTKITRIHVFEGPIPPPSILQDYEVVIPGAAERLIKAFEDESTHRRAMEKFKLEADVDARDRQLEIQEKNVNAVTRSDSIGQFLGATLYLLVSWSEQSSLQH